ncbi:MAG: Inosine-5'-monophosphate dehydrogenase [Nitrospirae bacterium]|nr:MAG: inosine-5'-monophosphate dehydrogenase [Nitrospira sp. OLB3]MBV6469745.1 Inosine-5'-monophosphate dehydrogenase [Nitrospirota bacterium]MCE7966981.1 IMP dehydrogenase [Nitrospira sp. NTP2]MCK6494507.1 IMP dehydrogenase [Nitrospira sp.]MEB2339787.1 IMP dehydrogenase [Nitrospirales bacterium]
MLEKEVRVGLTYDDVVLVPAKSHVLPSEVDTRTRVSRNIVLNIPIVSAAMDTVTEARLAIAMAQEGGIGIVHRVLSPADQAAEIDKVKKSESGMILDPITISPDQTIRDAHELMARYRISGIPVTKGSKLVGILTNRDLRFETRMDMKVSQVMRRDKLITAPEGTSLEKAREILHEHRIEKLPVVNKQFELKGLITIKDIEKRIKYPNACKDSHGRLRVGAALGVGPETPERVALLVKAGVDLVVVDTAHGHSQAVLETVKLVKKAHPRLDVVAGNIATAQAAKDLVKAGVDAVKVGVGPGSICTTRIVSGAGMPQLTAIADCAKVLAGTGVPVIADGGIKYSGDITKALAAGASSVMLGSLLAGTEESPGETVLYQARTYKVYRGMGSIGAMERGGGDRYGQGGRPAKKLVPEGIEGRVPYKGPLAPHLYQLVGGVKSGMGYCGCKTIPDLQQKATFIRQTLAGLREGHVHDVIITKEAPNYRTDWE